MDRLESMSVVLAVAEAGSLSAAARRQKMPLATVSRKVSELEEHLRTKLFHRSSRVLVPTDAGRSYIAAAKRILADLAEAERVASGEYTTPRGDLSVTTLVALGRLCLQPILAEFLAAFPEVDVQLNLQDRTLNLLDEHIDVALRVGELADSGLIAVRVGDIRRVACASPAYLELRGIPQSPDDLSAHDCISYPPLQSPNVWRFKRGQTEYAVPVRSRFIASNLESAFDAARAGIGVTVAFSYLVADPPAVGRTRRASAGLSAAAAAGQLRLFAQPLHAGQTASLSRFCSTAPEDAPGRHAPGRGVAEATGVTVSGADIRNAG
ncbi:DNA-binding transcriptional LysR family regulator [Bradyrhizobium liaoningense]